jgi:hypothetical protein
MTKLRLKRTAQKFTRTPKAKLQFKWSGFRKAASQQRHDAVAEANGLMDKQQQQLLRSENSNRTQLQTTKHITEESKIVWETNSPIQL